MTDQEFEALWERAESREYAARLAEEYPAWRSRRRRGIGVAVSAAIVLAVGLPLALPHTSHEDYERVYCNRSDVPESQWADLASTLLLES